MNAFENLLTAVEERPLSQSLPKALSVATAVQADDLCSWIRLELMGYFAENPAMTDEVVVPEYRTVVGSWFNDFGQRFVVPSSDWSFIDELRLRQGVAELEGLASASGPLSIREMDRASRIRQAVQVDVTTFVFEARSVAQVLTNVRVHLLDRLSAHREGIAALPVDPSSQSDEILELKPGMYGISVDLKALARRLFRPKP